MYDVKNFTSDKFYVISLLHLWNVVHWYIACSAWGELLKQLYHYLYDEQAELWFIPYFLS